MAIKYVRVLRLNQRPTLQNIGSKPGVVTAPKRPLDRSQPDPCDSARMGKLTKGMPKFANPLAHHESMKTPGLVTVN